MKLNYSVEYKCGLPKYRVGLELALNILSFSLYIRRDCNCFYELLIITALISMIL